MFKFKPRVHHLTAGVAVGAAVCSIFLLIAVSVGVAPLPARATPGMAAFGGRITAFNPISVVTGCPPHTVIFDYVTLTPLGIFAAPGSLIYDYKNLLTPGVHVLGEYIPIPIPTCLTPYPVYPIFQVGTSLIP